MSRTAGPGLLRRLAGLLEDGWPTRTVPTVPPAGRVAFHCPRCRAPVDDEATTCPACGTRLL